MIKYFGYGSNMDFTSLKAKGVAPKASHPATLTGWKLRFNVEHFFRHEGGVGNIEWTGDSNDRVLGVLHWCDDNDLSALDKLEAYGIGYDRIKVGVETPVGREEGFAYVGLPAYVNDACLPTQRYLNILLRGATTAGLDTDYLAFLQQHPTLKQLQLATFQPASTGALYEHKDLTPYLTVLAASVFDMSAARQAHVVARDWFGGKDVTTFHLKRMDSSDGSEQLQDVLDNRLRPDQRRYLNAYLHAFAEEYEYVGTFNYSSLPLEKQLA